MTDKTAATGWVDPLHRPVPAATVPGTGLEVTVAPTEPERVTLAKALGLAAVDSLTANYRLAARAGGIIVVTGEVKAAIRPVCVVTLEPFTLTVAEPVDLRFTDPENTRRRPARPDAAETESEDDPPDVIENGVIDLGKVTTEFLSLAIPPYPRAPGAAFAGKEEAVAVTHPFAALKALKDGQE